LEQACFRPGKADSFWPLFEKAHAEVQSEYSLEPPLLYLVHAVANQQKRATEAWRHRAAQTLGAELPYLKGLSERQLHSAVQEVIQLCAAVRSRSPR
jgi:hypothetical protein